METSHFDKLSASPCPLVTPLVEFQLGLLEKTRRRALELVESLTPDQLRTVPKGFHNNLLWNLGHLVVSQQVLCYAKSGLSPRAPAYLMPLFGKGTSPARWASSHVEIDATEIRTWVADTAALLRQDFEQHAFKTYEAYETSSGAVLTNIGEALTYVLWHEAMHLGVMMSQRKLV
jgi:hypothetical protein